MQHSLDEGVQLVPVSTRARTNNGALMVMGNE